MSRKKTGREGLLVWLQSRTAGYANVNVVDFTNSWVDGLAFCALLHSFCPELVKYEELHPAAREENLELAFSLADKLGIPRLIEPADMLVESGPNKFFVITYLAQFVEHFRRQDPQPESAPRSAFKRYEDHSTCKLQEAEHKRRLRSNISRTNVTRCMDRINLVKGGAVAGTIRELKRRVSQSKLFNSPQAERKRGGPVTERVAEFNRRTGSNTTHVFGDSYITERVPSGLVADRIATFLKNHKQVQLDIEFIMVSSPKLRRRRNSQQQSPSGQLMSNIYYVMRQDQTSTYNPNSNNPSDVHHPTLEPLAI